MLGHPMQSTLAELLHKTTSFFIISVMLYHAVVLKINETTLMKRFVYTPKVVATLRNSVRSNVLPCELIATGHKMDLGTVSMN